MSTRSALPYCAFGFQIGPLVEIDGDECRIGGPNRDGTVTFVSYRTGQHIPLSRDEFLTKVNSGAVLFGGASTKRNGHENSFLSALLNKTAGGATYANIDAYRREHVQALLTIKSGNRTKAVIDGLLARTHQEYMTKLGYPQWLINKTPPSRATAYRWLKAAEKRVNAGLLVPGFDLRGSRGGRFHPLIETFISELAAKFYFDVPEAQLSSSVRSIQTEVQKRISKIPFIAGHRTPSTSSIQRRILAMGGERRLEHDEGKRAAYVAYKPVMSGPDLLYPNARWEIDHTRIDINIVDADGERIVGRVWLTCIIDHKTRMIAGYLLDCQAPSASSVLAALRFAMLPKTRAQLDALGVKSEWPVAGVPTELATDRGRDLLSHSVQNALQALRIDLPMMPPRTPQYKGRIERFFGTLNSMLFHRLVGTTKSNTAAKGDRKPEQAARITFAELDSLIARTICDVYHNKQHSTLKCTPLEMWERLSARYPVPVFKSGPEIREATMLSYEAVATRSGINIEGTKYNSADVARIRSLNHSHIRGNPTVHVLLDPEDISQIHLRDPQSGKAVGIPALEAKRLRGVSLRMHRLIQAALKERGLSLEQSNYAILQADLMADFRQINRRKRRKFTEPSPATGRESAFAEPPASTAISTPTRPQKTQLPQDTTSTRTIPKLGKIYLGD
jgi:putative transposase